MDDNLYGVTIADMKLAITKGYRMTIKADKGFVFNKDESNGDTITIWPIKEGWQSARIVDFTSAYTNHQVYINLKDALTREWYCFHIGVGDIDETDHSEGLGCGKD